MKTPAGKDCPLYYADFHRGHHVQECRATLRPSSASWQPGDCRLCSIPDILLANASPNLRLVLSINAGILGFGRRLVVESTCAKHKVQIPDPYVGCEQCNAERPGLDAFLEAFERKDD